MKSLSPLFWYGLYTCRLISSVINDTEPPALPEDMSLDSLYAYQLSQDVISIAYAALERLDPSLNLEEYLMDNKKCILREARFDKTVLKAFIKQEGITDGNMATAQDFGDYLLSNGKIDTDYYSKKQEEARLILNQVI